MIEIYKSLEKYYSAKKLCNLTYSNLYNKLRKLKFSQAQLDQICFGLQDNIDITIYAKKEYSSKLMNDIRVILINEILTKEEKETQINLIIIEN